MQSDDNLWEKGGTATLNVTKLMQTSLNIVFPSKTQKISLPSQDIAKLPKTIKTISTPKTPNFASTTAQVRPPLLGNISQPQQRTFPSMRDAITRDNDEI